MTLETDIVALRVLELEDHIKYLFHTRKIGEVIRLLIEMLGFLPKRFHFIQT